MNSSSAYLSPPELTSSLDNVTTPTIYQKPFNELHVAIFASLILIFLVVGVVGNLLTILVIVSYKTLRSNVFMRFILSLCVSDLISSLISWLFLYRRTWGFDRWDPIPYFLCTFYWSADLMTSYVTALHILSFAVLRLISMKMPTLYGRIQMKQSHIWIGIMWAICIGCGFIPSLMIFGVGTPDRKSLKPNARWPVCTILETRLKEYRIFQHITFPTFLYVPTFGVVVLCVYIILAVKWRAEDKIRSTGEDAQQKKEKQAVIQLLLIIFAFLLGYIPFTAYEFWSIQNFPNEPYYNSVDYFFGVTEYLFLRFSECLNPLFYNLGSAKMRKFTKMFLRDYILRCKSIKTSNQNQIKPRTSHPFTIPVNTPPTAVTNPGYAL